MQSINNHDREQETHRGAATEAGTMDYCPTFDNSHNVQGKIFFLSAREELPYRAVKTVRPRADKGRVEQGVYNHPVVIVSRPDDEDNMVHFHPITTFQGRRIEQVYDKQSAHHISTRGWYLPIAPSPRHIDHDSTRKSRDLPTLELGCGATLRSGSYVNTRNVYSIELSLLKPYYNSNTPHRQLFRFTRKSTHEMLKRGRFVQGYVPGRQFGDLSMPTPEPIPTSTEVDRRVERNDADREPLIVVGVLPTTTVARESSSVSSSNQEDFRMLNTGGEPRARQRPGEPPDGGNSVFVMSLRPMGQFLEGFESAATVTHQRLMALSYDPNAIRRPLDRAWRDFKGVTAIAIASI